MKIYNDISELVGGTPLVKIKMESKANIFLKLEYFNPSNSVKDRAALNMIKDAEKKGLLHKGSLVVEATSGNTGIALATICSARGYGLILVIPDTMSIDKINHVKALGATVILTPGVFGMKKAFMEAERIHKENPNSFMPHQIDNPANPQIHTETTAVEIWDDMDGRIDVLVAGAGTGGTICGTARKLKELNQSIKIICVEPSGSAVLSGGKRGPHKLQGIGPGFIPDIVDVSLFDEIIRIDDEDAMNTSRSLARKEGLFLGISSGAATYAAIQISDKYKNKNIVVIAPDTGERYLNTELYNENIKNIFVS